VYNSDKLTHFTVSKLTTKFLCGAVATWEHHPHNFLAVSPHGVSVYGVFLLWDAQFGYWFQKGWSQRLKLCQTAFSGRKN